MPFVTAWLSLSSKKPRSHLPYSGLWFKRTSTMQKYTREIIVYTRQNRWQGLKMSRESGFKYENDERSKTQAMIDLHQFYFYIMMVKYLDIYYLH